MNKLKSVIVGKLVWNKGNKTQGCAVIGKIIHFGIVTAQLFFCNSTPCCVLFPCQYTLYTCKVFLQCTHYIVHQCIFSRCSKALHYIRFSLCNWKNYLWNISISYYTYVTEMLSFVNTLPTLRDNVLV